MDQVDMARADPLAAAADHVQARMQRRWPMFRAARPFKRRSGAARASVLHDLWAAEGAVFGLTAGWERGLWYARDASERDLPYSIGAQPWFPIVQREAAVMETGTVLLDLSPFGKFDISGPDALRFVQHIATANMDVSPGRAVYTALLNDRGGIEGDVTILRHGPDRFRLVSGAATLARRGVAAVERGGLRRNH